MPVIRYTLQVLDDVFSEADIFPYVKDHFAAVELISEQIVRPLQDQRRKIGEPELSLVKVEIINPLIHRHDWRQTHKDKMNFRSYYICDRCKITGWRRLGIFEERGGEVNRDESHKAQKYSLCREPLKVIPKTISFS
jgi:hypothetical protein